MKPFSKLTPKQKEVAARLAENPLYTTRTTDDWRTFQALVKHGWATEDKNLYGSEFEITAEGKAAYEQAHTAAPVAGLDFNALSPAKQGAIRMAYPNRYGNKVNRDMKWLGEKGWLELTPHGYKLSAAGKAAFEAANTTAPDAGTDEQAKRRNRVSVTEQAYQDYREQALRDGEKVLSYVAWLRIQPPAPAPDAGTCYRCGHALNETTKCPTCDAFNHTDATYAAMERERRMASADNYVELAALETFREQVRLAQLETESAAPDAGLDDTDPDWRKYAPEDSHAFDYTVAEAELIAAIPQAHTAAPAPDAGAAAHDETIPDGLLMTCPKCGAADHDCDCFMRPDGTVDADALEAANDARWTAAGYPPATPAPDADELALNEHEAVLAMAEQDCLMEGAYDRYINERERLHLEALDADDPTLSPAERASIEALGEVTPQDVPALDNPSDALYGYEVDWSIQHPLTPIPGELHKAHAELDRVERENDALRQERDELRSALKPFALAGDELHFVRDTTQNLADTPAIRDQMRKLMIGDLRRAAELLFHYTKPATRALAVQPVTVTEQAVTRTPVTIADVQRTWLKADQTVTAKMRAALSCPEGVSIETWVHRIKTGHVTFAGGKPVVKDGE